MWITARCAGPAVLLLGLPSCAGPAVGPAVLLLGVLSWAGPAGCAVLCWACQVAAGLLRMLGDLLWRFSSCHAVGKQRHRGICKCDPLPLPTSTACRPPCWTSSARARWRRARRAASLRCGLQENACPAAWCCAAQCLWPRRLPALGWVLAACAPICIMLHMPPVRRLLQAAGCRPRCLCHLPHVLRVLYLPLRPCPPHAACLPCCPGHWRLHLRCGLHGGAEAGHLPGYARARGGWLKVRVRAGKARLGSQVGCSCRGLAQLGTTVPPSRSLPRHPPVPALFLSAGLLCHARPRR